jgi:hypothetical protein
MIIHRDRRQASKRNTRQTRFQWRARIAERAFRRHLALRYGGWQYVHKTCDGRSNRWAIFQGWGRFCSDRRLFFEQP